MSPSDGVISLYKKYTSDIKYNTSLIISEIAAPLGAASIAYISDNIGMGKYFSSVAGGIAGNYFSAVGAFGVSWYLFNRKYYDTLNNFAKEYAEIILKNLIPAAASYLFLYIPIAAGFTYHGSTPSSAALYASILSAAAFFVGSNIINQKIIRKHRGSQ